MRYALVLAISLIVAHAEARAQAQDERCAVMFQNDAGAIVTEYVSNFRVTGAAAPFRLPEGYQNIRAVRCDRAALAIGDDDHRVITDAGLPLYIGSGDRVVVLEVSGGQFRARTVRGELTDDETDALRAALNGAQDVARRTTP